jgi:vancomycin resistance protein YoaR
MKNQDKSNNSSRIPWLEGAILAVVVIAAAAFSFRLEAAPPPEVEIAGFATSLQERTASQQHNARKAAAAIDGAVIQPGGVFSFNKTVKSWSSDRGYVKAPVSYDGDLIRAYGGGVCQTSTTLYNAALLAGLPILERHCHAFAPHYVPPGRDAAVAQYDIDLRFKNPYPWPIRIRAEAGEQRLNIGIYGAQKPQVAVDIATDMLSTVTPQRLTRVVSQTNGYSERPYLRNPGAVGYRAVTYRIFTANGKELRREQLGDDTYQAMNRVVQVSE